MRELKNSEIEAASGGRAVPIEKTPSLERLITEAVLRIAALHFHIKLPPTKAF